MKAYLDLVLGWGCGIEADTLEFHDLPHKEVSLGTAGLSPSILNLELAAVHAQAQHGTVPQGFLHSGPLPGPQLFLEPPVNIIICLVVSGAILQIQPTKLGKHVQERSRVMLSRGFATASGVGQSSLDLSFWLFDSKAICKKDMDWGQSSLSSSEARATERRAYVRATALAMKRDIVYGSRGKPDL